MKKRNKFLILLFCILCVELFCRIPALSQNVVYEKGLNFYVANDLGRNGYYKQKTIADLMGQMAALFQIRFIVAAGDTHHFNGVQSTQDPLWMTNFELIYTHPDLMCFWYPILGNHEYQGNTQAVIDYSNVSRRWKMPARYYSKLIPETGNNASVLLVFIDTSPLIDDYWKKPESYPDVQKQDTAKQIAWIDSVLANSSARFKIVIGHHPIYVSEKMRSTEESLVKKLDPLLNKYNVSVYVAGHSHTFQHIRKKNSDVHYVVNGSGSSGRDPLIDPDTEFCSSNEGFSVISIGKDKVKMSFINFEGKPIHQFEVK